MANLETLELTINANAKSASEGLNKLINSLSAVSKKVEETYNKMSKLNSEIKKIGGIGNLVNMPNIAGVSSAKRATRIAKTVQTQLIPAPNQMPNGSMVMTPDGRNLPVITNADVKIVTDVGKATEQSAKEMGFFEKAATKAKNALSNISKSMSRVGRIFSTMMIRTAIRSLIKAFSEAWQNAYQFSKSMGGEFAQSVDKVKSLLAATATNIISAFSPALSALVPVVQAVAAAIQYLCNIIKSLFSMLGWGSDLFGATADSINKFAGSASGGSKAAKEMLASFDELNVISQESGGGGGGGGGSYTSGLLSGIVSDEMARVQLIVSEALLAVGLILACTGHIGLGVGLMAIGAAGIAKTVIEDWGKLSSNVQGELATIMSIIGVSTLAVGAILAFSGVNIPLGVGLMAIGAANLAAVAYVNWKNGLPENVRSTITTITGIVGTALLALGAILTFSGAKPALGIGLMVAGAASLATAVALNWSNIQTKLQLPISYITTLVSGALLALGAILTFSGAKVPLGIGLMVAGATGLAASLACNWSSIQTRLQGPIGKITTVISTALLAVGAVLAFSGASVPLGISLIAAGAVGLVTTLAANWDSLGTTLTGSVSTVTSIISTALLAVGAILTFSGANLPLGIGLMSAGAVGLATTIAVNWTTITTKLQNPIARITAIVGGALLALGAVLAFSGANIPLGIAMMAAGGVALVSAIAVDWNGLVGDVIGAFNQVKDTLINGWDDVKKALSDAFQPIKDASNWVRELLGLKGKSVDLNVNVKVNTYQNYTQAANNIAKDVATNAGNVLSAFFNAYNTATKGAGTSGGHGFASGGFPDRGELFIAQEAGAELVGSINGKTSVANQQQIIEGISSGVERANAEQNVLLRQQNELLRGILEKELNVNLGASAKFGRTVRQSLDMYDMVGG